MGTRFGLRDEGLLPAAGEDGLLGEIDEDEDTDEDEVVVVGETLIAAVDVEGTGAVSLPVPPLADVYHFKF